jgi:cell division protease FtsH
VCEWGMSEKLGPIHYSSKEEHVFLGRELGKPREHSEHTQVEIDREVKAILDGQYQVAKRILSENLDTLHRLAKALLERETLDSSDIEAILRGDPLPPPQGPNGGSDGSGGPASGSEGNGATPSKGGAVSVAV